MLNMHGLTIKGLKKASGETENYGYYDGRYNEIFYNVVTGEVWTVFQCSLGQNTWTEYHNKNVVKICNATNHMTMQQIADAIHETVEHRKLQAEWEAEIERQYQETHAQCITHPV